MTGMFIILMVVTSYKCNNVSELHQVLHSNGVQCNGCQYHPMKLLDVNRHCTEKKKLNSGYLLFSANQI